MKHLYTYNNVKARQKNTFFLKSLTWTWIERRNPYFRRALCWLPQWMSMEGEARKAWITVSNNEEEEKEEELHHVKKGDNSQPMKIFNACYRRSEKKPHFYFSFDWVYFPKQYELKEDSFWGRGKGAEFWFIGGKTLKA